MGEAILALEDQTEFDALMQTIRSVDEAVHALNDEDDRPSKLATLERLLQPLRERVGDWLSREEV